MPSKCGGPRFHSETGPLAWAFWHSGCSIHGVIVVAESPASQVVKPMSINVNTPNLILAHLFRDLCRLRIPIIGVFVELITDIAANE